MKVSKIFCCCALLACSSGLWAKSEWVINRGNDGLKIFVNGGYNQCELGLTTIYPTTTDVMVTLPMAEAFTASDHPFFAMSYRITTQQKIGGLFFMTDSYQQLNDTSYTPFSIVGDGTWRTVIVDMRKAKPELWKGKITHVRLDPTNPSDTNSKIEVSRCGFFPDIVTANKFLNEAQNSPDYSIETVIRGTNYRACIPANTLKEGWKRSEFTLCDSAVPKGDGVLSVCCNGKPVPSAVTERGYAIYEAAQPGRYTLQRVDATQAKPLFSKPIPTWDRNRFQIGAYCLNPAKVRTDKVIKDIKDCGIDFIIGISSSDVATLDLFAKNGVGAIVDGLFPGWWGGDGDNAGKMYLQNPLEKYVKAASTMLDHPAIIAADIGDEPSALDFPHYGNVIKALKKVQPNLPLYLNLYPNYASVAENTGKQTVNQLGTTSYFEHIAWYSKDVPLDYISYDFYPYMKNSKANDVFRLKMYDNFKIVADACRKTNRDFWYIPQVNSRYGDMHMTENTLRFQAYTAMAFGSVSITWACWTPGWWTNNVITATGEHNVEYDRLKCVNGEIRRFAPEFMRFKNVATHFVGFPASEKLDTIGIHVENALQIAPFTDLCATDNTSLIIGEMDSRKPNQATKALWVMAADDMYDKHPTQHTVTFRANASQVKILRASSEEFLQANDKGVFSFSIKSNEAVLLIADKHAGTILVNAKQGQQGAATLPTGAGDFEIEAPHPNNNLTIKAVDFGFSPTNTLNGAAIERALAAAKAKGAIRVELASGVYRCFDAKGITIDGFKDFVFDGCGAHLVFKRSGGNSNFNILNNQRSVVKNFTMDWDWDNDPLASLGTCINKFVDEKNDDASYIDMKLDRTPPCYPATPSLQTMTTIDDMRENLIGTPPNRLVFLGNAHGPKSQWIAPNVLRIWPGVKPAPDAYVTPHYVCYYNPRQNRDTVRAIPVGISYRLLHYYYGLGAVQMVSNQHFSLEDIDIWSCRGHGLGVSGTQHHWQVKNVNLAPPADKIKSRLTSSTADGHHISRSLGWGKYINFTIAFCNDDSHNFHDCTAYGVPVGSNQLKVTFSGGVSYLGAKVGHTIELREMNFDPVHWFGKVVKIEGNTLTMDHKVPQPQGDRFLFFNRSMATDHILMKGCVCRNSHFRNLFQMNDLTLEDCIFERVGSASVQFTSSWLDNLWCEGMGVTNCVIRNCQFILNNQQTRGRDCGWAAEINSCLEKPRNIPMPLTKPGFFAQILVENCTFQDPSGQLVTLYCAKDFTFRNNTIRDNGLIKPRHQRAAGLNFNNCLGVTIENNQWQLAPNLPLPVITYDANCGNIQCRDNKVN